MSDSRLTCADRDVFAPTSITSQADLIMTAIMPPPTAIARVTSKCAMPIVFVVILSMTPRSFV